jgi:hypothetical protein
MALAPADFYAYSRATGVPVPEDPEERAALAPEVLEFRRNQLRAPQEESNLPGILGTAALGLSALGAGAYGLTRLAGRGRQQEAPIFRTPQSTDLSTVQKAVIPEVEQYEAVKPSFEPPATAIPQATVDLGTSKAVPGERMVRRHGRMVPASTVKRTPTAIPQTTVDLTTIQQIHEPEIIDQFVEATDPGLDQSFQRNVVRPEQRDTDFAKFSRSATQITERNDRLRAAADQIWGFEEELERLGQQAQRYAASRQPSDPSSFALRGTLEEAGYRRTKGSKLLPQEIVHEGGRRLGMSEEDIADRISAAANYREDDPRRFLLLNPDVPTEKVSGLMPNRLLVRGGRVGRNLTSEIQPGARASMTDVELDVIPGYEGSDIEEAYNVATGNIDSDYISDMGGYGSGRFSDYDANAADYGDLEGPGGLVETRAFKERTNKGTTMVPGQISEAEAAAGGSLRQEREIDTVLPTRMTEEGDAARGFFINPETGQLSFQGASKRIGEPRRGVLETEDINVEGSKLIGGFEVPSTSVSSFVATQPVTDYRPKVVRGADGKLYEASGQEVVGEEPLIGFRRTKLTSPEGKTLGYTTLENIKPVAMTLPRQELQSIIQDGVDRYFNDPTAKRAFLSRTNPQAIETGLAQGKTLSEIGGPLDFQNFLVEHLDSNLMSQGIDLPLLKPQVNKTTGARYFTSAAHTFTTNLRKTTQETPVYGKPYQVDPATGRRVVAKDPETGKALFDKAGGVIYSTEGEARPIPGMRDARGGGGIDPMTVGDEGVDVDVSYYSPRISTAPLRESGTSTAPSTPTGSLMTVLREQMETQPVGMRPRSPGSFARTQNPYTGAAAAAMGPVARVLSGNYQYPQRQLTVNLEPRSTSQLQQRNQFALTANLTPGGQVVRGQQELGAGLGTVPGGIGSLSESETIQRYGAAGSQLEQFGNQLMSQAASRRQQQSASTTPPVADPIQARNDAVARHIGNYISAASQRMEGPASIQGVKLKGVGQNALRPYQAPSEGMIQQLMRAARRR